MLKIKTKGDKLSVKWTARLDEVDSDLRSMYEMLAPRGGDEATLNFLKSVFVGLAEEVCRGGDVEAMRRVLRKQLWRTGHETEYKPYKIV